ncbi:hypothetical protein CW749_05535 [Vibrio sp. vnigr-6D03]|nr:hypothetical protein CW749_05535 [Vibrio sp. vnigr-6D03]
MKPFLTCLAIRFLALSKFIQLPLFSETQEEYNAQLSSQKRTNAVPENYLKHKTHRKLKMPRVFGLLELFVVAIQANKLTWQ